MGAGTPAAAATGTGQLLLVLAVAAHAWSLRPRCRGAGEALAWALGALVVTVVLVGALTEIVFDLYTRTSVAGEIGGLVAGLLAGLLLPFPVHLVLGAVLRRHLRPVGHPPPARRR